jgi:hypothetical protein
MSDSAEMFPEESVLDQGTRMLGGPSTIEIPEQFQYKRFALVWNDWIRTSKEENIIVVVSVPNLLILMSSKLVKADLVLN